jgi:hypothetical protein
MFEKRRERRARSYLTGIAVFNKRFSTADCLIRNLSQNGARLEFWNTPLIPVEFELIIPRRGATRRATIIWQRDLVMGLFLKQKREGDVIPIEMARALKTLRDERETLLRRIADLTEGSI